MKTYLESRGILIKPGLPHSHQLNGVAERSNRTICNMIQASLISSHLPKSFWADALRHSIFAFNSFPCKTPSGFVSPKSLLHHNDVPLSYLHPFGCRVWYKVPEADQSKLNRKGKCGDLLSYLSNGNGYQILDSQSRKVI